MPLSGPIGGASSIGVGEWRLGECLILYTVSEFLCVDLQSTRAPIKRRGNLYLGLPKMHLVNEINCLSQGIHLTRFLILSSCAALLTDSRCGLPPPSCEKHMRLKQSATCSQQEYGRRYDVFSSDIRRGRLQQYKFRAADVAGWLAGWLAHHQISPLCYPD